MRRLVPFPLNPKVSGAVVACSDCVDASYFGAATAVVARYDLYPPVIGATKRSPDVHIGCGAPPGPGIPTPPDCQNNPQPCARRAEPGRRRAPTGHTA